MQALNFGTQHAGHMRRRRVVDMTGKQIGLVESQCAECKREFVRHEGEWGYIKRPHGKALLFCSYRCMRAYERAQDAARAASGKRKTRAKTTAELIESRREYIARDENYLASAEGQALSAEEKRALKRRISRYRQEIRRMEEQEYENPNS